MADEIRINRTQSSPSPVQPQPQPAQPAPSEDTPASSSRAPWIILAVVIIVLAVAGVLFRDKLFGNSKGAVKGVSTQDTSYQAVFLTNGQVYFGKLSNASNDYVTLKDIYYLQVGPQQGSAAGQAGQAAAAPAGQSISLVKLGNELHGPVDEMHISRAQVLFYEDLKEDGQVVKAILTDKSTKK